MVTTQAVQGNQFANQESFWLPSEKRYRAVSKMKSIFWILNEMILTIIFRKSINF